MPQTVLVVDDDPVMLQLMGYYLGRAGYEMINAHNGREALEMAERDLPHLIVLDLRMPEMGGLTALRQLKETVATEAIPVIIIARAP